MAEGHFWDWTEKVWLLEHSLGIWKPDFINLLWSGYPMRIKTSQLFYQAFSDTRQLCYRQNCSICLWEKVGQHEKWVYTQHTSLSDTNQCHWLPLGISGGQLPSGQVRQFGRLGVGGQRGAGSLQRPSSHSWLTQSHCSHRDTPCVCSEAARSHTPCSVQRCGFTAKSVYFFPHFKLSTLQTLQTKACKLRMDGSLSSCLLHTRKKLSAS